MKQIGPGNEISSCLMMIQILFHLLTKIMWGNWVRRNGQGSKSNLCLNKAMSKQQEQSKTTTTPQCNRKSELLGVRG